MRIAFTGPCSSGKTTLANYMTGKYDLPLIREMFRSSAERFQIQNLNRQYPQKLLEACQYHAILEQVAQENSMDRFVSDRSIYCMMFYASKLFLNKSLVREYYDLALMTQADNYDIVFYVPPFGMPKDDGFRFTGYTEKSREQENADYRKFLNDPLFRLNIVDVTTTDLNDRIAEVEAAFHGHFDGTIPKEKV